MTILEQWEKTFSRVASPLLSPSGHAIAIIPLDTAPGFLMYSLEIRFADNRPALKVVGDGMIHLLEWASDTEFVYRVIGDVLEEAPLSTLWVLWLEDGTASQVMVETDDTFVDSVAKTGRPGHLSVLSEPHGRPGVFDLDIRTGNMVRLTAFDAGMKNLEVYPGFGHSWSEERREAAIIAWPLGEHLAAGVEPTPENSRYKAGARNPSKGDNQCPGDVAQAAPHKTPPHLFILSATGACHAVPETFWADDPVWSPDSSLIAFQKHRHRASNEMWIARRADFELLPLGSMGSLRKTLMHPSGVLLSEKEDKSLPINAKISSRLRMTPTRWCAFRLQDGEVSRQ